MAFDRFHFVRIMGMGVGVIVCLIWEEVGA